MITHIPGVHTARDGELLDVILHKRNNDGSLTVETLYSPTTEDLDELFSRYGLPVDYCFKIIRERGPGVHSMLLDLDRFNEHLKEIGYRR